MFVQSLLGFDQIRAAIFSHNKRREKLLAAVKAMLWWLVSVCGCDRGGSRDWATTLQREAGQTGRLGCVPPAPEHHPALGSSSCPSKRQAMLLVACTGTQLGSRNGNTIKDQQKRSGFIGSWSSPEHHKLKEKINPGRSSSGCRLHSPIRPFPLLHKSLSAPRFVSGILHLREDLWT